MSDDKMYSITVELRGKSHLFLFATKEKALNKYNQLTEMGVKCTLEMFYPPNRPLSLELTGVYMNELIGPPVETRKYSIDEIKQLQAND